METSTIDGKELVKQLAESNQEQYNYLKLVEECTELNEAILKSINKIGRSDAPSEQDIIDEMGDVFIRLRILSEKLGFEKVQARINYKLAQMGKWYYSGNYNGKC